jgi:7-keto-8-aminopelargonate synthetase-like enzyme
MGIALQSMGGRATCPQIMLDKYKRAPSFIFEQTVEPIFLL